MDTRCARVARELADQGIDRRRGTSLFVLIAAMLVALGIGLVRTAPSFASPRAASRAERDVAVRKHDERGNESDVLVLRDDHGGDKDRAARDRGRGYDRDHRGGKHHKHHGKDRHGGKGKHTGGHQNGTKGGTTHRTVGGETGVHTKPGGTHAGGGNGGAGTKATGRTRGAGATVVTGGPNDTTAATADTTVGVTSPTVGGTGAGTWATCTGGDDGVTTSPEPLTNPGDWQTNWRDV
jgi:hypothetical protein